MAEFKLFGEKFQIPDSYIRDHLINSQCIIACKYASEEFYKWYNNCFGINNVVKDYENIAAYLMD